MTNENFRRELGQVFDDMTGSPSSALPDRVRSSLANAPEQQYHRQQAMRDRFAEERLTRKLWVGVQRA